MLTGGLILCGFVSDDPFSAPFEMRPCLCEIPQAVAAADLMSIQ